MNVAPVTKKERPRALLAILCGCALVAILLFLVVGSIPSIGGPPQATPELAAQNPEEGSSRPSSQQARRQHGASPIAHPVPSFKEASPESPSLGKVYKPVAFEAFRAQMYDSPAKTPDYFYELEKRVEEWAAPMEENLQRRFAPEAVAKSGLPTLKLDKIECRASSCRMEVSWTQADLAAPKNNPEGFRYGNDPLGHLAYEQGLISWDTYREPPQVGDMTVPDSYHVSLTEDGRFKATEFIMFGEKDIDPATYLTWADNHKPLPLKGGKPQ